MNINNIFVYYFKSLIYNLPVGVIHVMSSLVLKKPKLIRLH